MAPTEIYPSGEEPVHLSLRERIIQARLQKAAAREAARLAAREAASGQYLQIPTSPAVSESKLDNRNGSTTASHSESLGVPNACIEISESLSEQIVNAGNQRLRSLVEELISHCPGAKELAVSFFDENGPGDGESEEDEETADLINGEDEQHKLDDVNLFRTRSTSLGPSPSTLEGVEAPQETADHDDPDHHSNCPWPQPSHGSRNFVHVSGVGKSTYGITTEGPDIVQTSTTSKKQLEDHGDAGLEFISEVDNSTAINTTNDLGTPQFSADNQATSDPAENAQVSQYSPSDSYGRGDGLSASVTTTSLKDDEATFSSLRSSHEPSESRVVSREVEDECEESITEGDISEVYATARFAFTLVGPGNYPYDIVSNRNIDNQKNKGNERDSIISDQRTLVYRETAGDEAQENESGLLEDTPVNRLSNSTSNPDDSKTVDAISDHSTPIPASSSFENHIDRDTEHAYEDNFDKYITVDHISSTNEEVSESERNIISDYLCESCRKPSALPQGYAINAANPQTIICLHCTARAAYQQATARSPPRSRMGGSSSGGSPAFSRFSTPLPSTRSSGDSHSQIGTPVQSPPIVEDSVSTADIDEATQPLRSFPASPKAVGQEKPRQLQGDIPFETNLAGDKLARGLQIDTANKSSTDINSVDESQFNERDKDTIIVEVPSYFDSEPPTSHWRKRRKHTDTESKPDSEDLGFSSMPAKRRRGRPLKTFRVEVQLLPQQSKSSPLPKPKGKIGRPLGSNNRPKSWIRADQGRSDISPDGRASDTEINVRSRRHTSPVFEEDKSGDIQPALMAPKSQPITPLEHHLSVIPSNRTFSDLAVYSADEAEFAALRQSELGQELRRDYEYIAAIAGLNRQSLNEIYAIEKSLQAQLPPGIYSSPNRRARIDSPDIHARIDQPFEHDSPTGSPGPNNYISDGSHSNDATTAISASVSESTLYPAPILPPASISRQRLMTPRHLSSPILPPASRPRPPPILPPTSSRPPASHCSAK
jgi:hypothetical protein